jgi:hypothetical protein
MDAKHLESGNFRLIYKDRQERQAMAEACYEAVGELVRAGEAEYSVVVNHIIKSLIDLANGSTASERQPEVKPESFEHAREALRMFCLKGMALSLAFQKYPEIRDAFERQGFTGDRSSLRELAGQMLMDLGGPQLRSNNDAAPQTFSTAIEDSRLAGS